jgi:hypothetical protein
MCISLCMLSLILLHVWLPNENCHLGSGQYESESYSVVVITGMLMTVISLDVIISKHYYFMTTGMNPYLLYFAIHASKSLARMTFCLDTNCVLCSSLHQSCLLFVAFDMKCGFMQTPILNQFVLSVLCCLITLCLL